MIGAMISGTGRHRLAVLAGGRAGASGALLRRRACPLGGCWPGLPAAAHRRGLCDNDDGGAGASGGGGPERQLKQAEALGLLKLLGLRSDSLAQPAVIKAAYFELAKKMHPDVVALGQKMGHAQPWLRFSELTMAFESLIAYARQQQRRQLARDPDGGEDEGDEDAAAGRRPLGREGPRGLSRKEAACFAEMEQQLGSVRALPPSPQTPEPVP